MTNKTLKTFCAALLALYAFVLTTAFLGGGKSVFAAEVSNPLTGGDGTYSCGYTIGGTTESGKGMIASSCESTVKIERTGGLFYLYFALTSAQFMQDFKMTLEGKQIGQLVASESGNRREYMLTLGAASVQKTFAVSMFVTAMNSGVGFTISLNLSGAIKNSDGIETSVVDRPAEFVPVLRVNADPSYSLLQGSRFTIPFAAAAIGGTTCETVVSAYFYNGAKEPVTVTNNGFTLAKSGAYYIVYTATSTAYLTSSGNPSVTVLEILVNSSPSGGVQVNPIYADDSAGVSIEDIEGAVNGYAEISATIITSGMVYENIGKKLKKISDKYRITEVALTDGSGAKIALSGTVKISLTVPTTFDKSKTAVYFLSANGELTELNGSISGNKLTIETTVLGTFIFAEKNLTPFPKWATALIVTASVLAFFAAAMFLCLKKQLLFFKKRGVEN